MRILAFSDLHGDASLIDKVKEMSEECDFMICCGDITPVGGNTIITGRKLGRFNRRMFIVPGNFELPTDINLLCKEMGWTDLHGKTFEVNGVIISGCGGGGVGPFGTPYELSEAEFRSILDKIDRKPTILVTHSPPKGILDEVRGKNIGSEEIRNFVEAKEPLLNLCGHVHENGGKESKLGNTKVMNIARQVKIIEL